MSTILVSAENDFGITTSKIDFKKPQYVPVVKTPMITTTARGTYEASTQ